VKSDNFVAKTRDCRDSLYNVVINGISNDTIVLTSLMESGTRVSTMTLRNVEVEY